MFVYLCISLST